MMKPIHVIGIGQGKQNLTQQYLDIIRTADVLVGGRRLLNLFCSHQGETIVLDRHIDRAMDKIKDRMTRCQVVVLASGDPLFYGIGTTLMAHIDKTFIQFYPNICSVAAAFAALKEPWHDVKIISLHNRSLPDFCFVDLARENRVAFLTSPAQDPVFIAKNLIDYQVSGFRFYVLEALGDMEKEKISWFDDPARVLDQSFFHPNVVILIKQNTAQPANVSHETHPGMADDRFRHSSGLITKSEVRSISLSKLKLVRKDHILWDIGSGSGSVGIEASFTIPGGQVVAIEKTSSRISDITHNINQFQCPNVQVKQLDFPRGADTLPRPDRIFVGGGGRALDDILVTACDRLMENGVIVVNTVLVQNMTLAFACLEKNRLNPEMIQVQISRSRTMPYGTRLESLNPVWIIFGTKPKT
ncbi:MAG: precorrin-6y C5,15-methyltransferase (decarboxylating) subunit CbiE [Desulfotignum sp.]|nr:precorrin-6y C5,15-methyltransferase (decarboxylating) subunit CbiE [Desulfotignum sp.]